jgi:hypothetical protein
MIDEARPVVVASVALEGLVPSGATDEAVLLALVLVALRHGDRIGTGMDRKRTQVVATFSLLGAGRPHSLATGIALWRRANRDPIRTALGAVPALGENQWVGLSVEPDTGFGGLWGFHTPPERQSDQRCTTRAHRGAAGDEIDEIVSVWRERLDNWSASAKAKPPGIAPGLLRDAARCHGA